MEPKLDFLRTMLAQDPIAVVDVGARNGTFEIPGLAPLIHVYGFEPNKKEYDKILSGQTDSYKVSGVKPPPYAKVFFSPVALGHIDGKQTLYVTKGPGACSLLLPNDDLIQNYEKAWAWNFEVIGREEVVCATLESFMQQCQLNKIDYIKLDTQGNEFEILCASTDALRSISVIKTEVEFVQMYQGQKIFHEFDAALRSAGFHFVDLLCGTDHRIGRRESQGRQGKKELLWADAIYARELSVAERAENPLLALKQALILLEIGYQEYGFHLLKKIPGSEKLQPNQIQQAYSAPAGTFKRWIPVRVKTAGRKFLRKILG